MNSGTYLIQALLQIKINPQNNSAFLIDFWWKKNGVTIPLSNYQYSLLGQGSSLVIEVVGVNATIYDISAGDVLSLWIYQPATNINPLELLATTASTNGTFPGTPSVNVNITQCAYTGPTGPLGPTGSLNYYTTGTIPNNLVVNQNGGTVVVINSTAGSLTNGTQFTAPSGGLNKFRVTVSYCIQFNSNSNGLLLYLKLYVPTTYYSASTFTYDASNSLYPYYNQESPVGAAVSGSFTDIFNLGATTISAGTTCYMQLYSYCLNTNTTTSGSSTTTSKLTFNIMNITQI